MYEMSKKGSQIKGLLEETKIIMNKNKRKNIMSLKRYILISFFCGDTLACKNKTINKEIEQILIADSGSTSHMVNSLKNKTNLLEIKIVVKTGIKENDDGIALRRL